MTVDRGLVVLLPLSRIVAACLAGMIILSYFRPTPAVSGKWIWHASMLVMLMVMAKFEDDHIFPVNEKLLAMGRLEKWTLDRENRLENLLEARKGDVSGLSSHRRWLGSLIPPIALS